MYIGIPVYVLVAGVFLLAVYTESLAFINPVFVEELTERSTFFFIFLMFWLAILMIAINVLTKLINVSVDKKNIAIYVDDRKISCGDVDFLLEAGIFGMNFAVVKVDSKIKTWIPMSCKRRNGYPIYFRKKPRNENIIIFASFAKSCKG